MNEDCHSVLSDGTDAVKEPENSKSLEEEGNSEPADAYEEAPIVEISRPKAYIQIFLPYFFQLARLSNDGAPSIQR